jgi:hypothetical protein
MLLSEGVVEIIELGRFVRTRMVTCGFVAPDSVFNLGVRFALIIRLSKNLRLRILFVLLVAWLFSLLKVVMTSVLLINLPVLKLRRLSFPHRRNLFSFEFLISSFSNLSVSLIYNIYLLIQVGIYLLNLRLSWY